mgnify:FL=1
MSHTSQDVYLEKINKALQSLYIGITIKSTEEKTKENNLKFQEEKQLEKIKDLQPLDLIEYIKDTIDIYTNLKTNKNEEENLDEKAIEAYEIIIKQLEADKRNHIKVLKNK